MPNNYDFSNLENLKSVEVNPEGWISPLYVEYGMGLYGDVLAYYWRVKGTKHTFVIPVLRMDYLSQGEYEKHFKEALLGFREDWVAWSKEGWYAEWMREYREQYSDFISL